MNNSLLKAVVDDDDDDGGGQITGHLNQCGDKSGNNFCANTNIYISDFYR